MNSDERCLRSVDDVLKTLEQAKINADALNPCTQVLQFSDTENNYKCLELNKELLEALEKGESFVIRGQKNDSAVLCTHDTTYDLKEAETSNSLLILKELTFPSEVDSTLTDAKIEIREVSQLVQKYLEPRVCKPRFHSLLQLLGRRPYKGPECEGEGASEEAPLTTEALLDAVQASQGELSKELSHLAAIEINGSWRLLDFHYNFRVLSFLLRYFDEESMSLKQLRMEESIDALKDLVPREILVQVFHWYTRPSSQQVGGETVYCLDEDRVCRTLAEAVLRPASKFPLAEFLRIWQESVPEGLQTNVNQLAGMAVIEKTVSPALIWYFPERDLPEDVHQRLHKLFQERQAWPLDDISPYMQRLATPQLSVNALLAKYARMSTKDGVKYFTGRHSK